MGQTSRRTAFVVACVVAIVARCAGAVSPGCEDSIASLLEGDELDTLLRMFDASGKLPPGLLAGNRFSRGSFEECEDIGHDFARYCLTTAYLYTYDVATEGTSVIGAIQWGVCLPPTCSNSEDVESLIRALLCKSACPMAPDGYCPFAMCYAQHNSTDTTARSSTDAELLGDGANSLIDAFSTTRANNFPPSSTLRAILHPGRYWRGEQLESLYTSVQHEASPSHQSNASSSFLEESDLILVGFATPSTVCSPQWTTRPWTNGAKASLAVCIALLTLSLTSTFMVQARGFLRRLVQQRRSRMLQEEAQIDDALEGLRTPASAEQVRREHYGLTYYQLVDGSASYGPTPPRAVTEEQEAVQNEWPSVASSSEQSYLTDQSSGLQRIAYAAQDTFALIVNSFNVARNIDDLLKVDSGPKVRGKTVRCLDGLRTLSMAWVVLGHTYIWTLSLYDNPSKVLETEQRFSAQVLDNGFLSVDSFLFVSGLLAAYIMLGMAAKSDKLPFVKLYVFRILRLLPLYMFVIMCQWWLLPYLVFYSPASMGLPSVDPNCSKYWWTNLIFISNFYPTELKDICFPVSWYLSLDMQLYILVPFVVLLFHRHQKSALATLLALLCTTWIVTASIDYHWNEPPNMMAYPGQPIEGWKPDVYTKPYTRSGPYIVGVLTGLVLRNGWASLFFQRYMTVWRCWLGWAASATVMVTVVYGLYPLFHYQPAHTFTRAGNVAYGTLHRTAWGVGLSWITLACHNGWGWWVNDILGAPQWQPWSRLSFACYLVHPFVLSIFTGSSAVPLHYSDLNATYWYLGTLVLTHVGALLVYLFVEAPVGRLIKASTGSSRHK